MRLRLFSAQAVQRVGCGSVNLFRDDFRRIAMPLLLVPVLISVVVLPGLYFDLFSVPPPPSVLALRANG
jgi:hypothetical protein